MTTAPFLVLRGQLHILGYSPDGDSLRFEADDSSLWQSRVRLNGDDRAQLRIEGIDTPESHYLGEHQPEGPTNKATRALLRHVGFQNVRWSEGHKKVTHPKNPLDAVILTRGPDKYGRPISFLFKPEDIPFVSGHEVELTTELLALSANQAMLQNGWAYPTFYENMPPQIRSAMMMVAREARQARRGSQYHDRSMTGVDVSSKSVITDDVMIMPKLFRRLINYMRSSAYDGTLNGFLEYLAKPKNVDPLYVVGDDGVLREHDLDDLLTVSANVLTLNTLPERLVFQEK